MKLDFAPPTPRNGRMKGSTIRPRNASGAALEDAGCGLRITTGFEPGSAARLARVKIMGKPDEILRYGGQQWELHRHAYCEQCELLARLRNRASARMWLQQFKGNRDAMDELRRLLSRESDVSLRLNRASDDAILDQAAYLFEIGRWHVHGSHSGH